MLLLSVIAREFREAARKKRAHGLRTAFGAAMASWVGIEAVRQLASGPAAVGQAIFLSLATPLAYVVLLVSPVLASVSIARERREDTLGLLLLTHLRPRHIVLAKFTARLIEMLGLVLLVLPLLAISIFFGGVTPQDVICVGLMLFALVLLGTVMGVCVSAFFRHAWLALATTIFLLFGLDQLIVLVCDLPPDLPGDGLLSLSLLVLDPGTDPPPTRSRPWR